MHPSSLENMQKCIDRHLAFERRPPAPLISRSPGLTGLASRLLSLGSRRNSILRSGEQRRTVVEIGSADVNGTYRRLFPSGRFCYVGCDRAPGPGVDLVLDDPYRLPFANGYADIVISGQMLEHCERFWLAFAEMLRILKPDGYLFLIAPSAGPIHRCPVDCWRFYPDGYRALADWARCQVVDLWLDERGPWQDLVGVFRRTDAPTFAAPALRAAPQSPGWSGAPGTSDEEAVAGSLSYLEILDRLHRALAPAHYLEIGVRHGISLALARGPATGVDPSPALDRDLPPAARLVPLTSDEFFARHTGEARFDLGFIDGMHLFEQALRDFMNFERCAAPGAVAVIDDVLPNHPAQAERERRTRAWTGDVWRVVEVLKRYRPDLFLLTLDAAPAGLLLVAGLDPANRVLWDAYNPIVREAREFVGPPQGVLLRQDAADPTGEAVGRVLAGLKEVRAEHCPPHEVGARLRRISESGPAHRPPPRPDAPKLSVIIIGYNMARELPRTIRSLSPAMQRDIDPDDYEIILIDNGSTEGFDEAGLRRLLPGLVVHRRQNAAVSPVPAINFGLSVARGDLVGVCIDGARMASPGLLSKALAASRLHVRPVIGTLSFHLGSEVQMESVRRGYDQAVEDALLAGSGWEADGYRLFTIAAFAGSSSGGWFEVPEESNAVFLRAEHWRALGGWDEGFVTPGGGLANLDTWARACADPTGGLIMLLGEATFHQFHGGIATNSPDPPQALFHEEYVRLRGRAYERPTRQPLYFGTLPETMGTSLRASLDRMSAGR